MGLDGLLESELVSIRHYSGDLRSYSNACLGILYRVRRADLVTCGHQLRDCVPSEHSMGASRVDSGSALLLEVLSGLHDCPTRGDNVVDDCNLLAFCIQAFGCNLHSLSVESLLDKVVRLAVHNISDALRVVGPSFVRGQNEVDSFALQILAYLRIGSDISRLD